MLLKTSWSVARVTDRHVWRSILFGRKLLKEGMIRSIGDGSNTYVWSDKWIMESQPRHPVNKQRNIDVLQRDSTLIDESGNWKMDVLNSLFTTNEIKHIQRIMPGRSPDSNI